MKDKDSLQLFSDLLAEVRDTNLPLSSEVYSRIEQAYKYLTDEVFDRIAENQKEGKKYIVQLKKSVNELYVQSIVLFGRFDVSMGAFRFMKKEPDRYRAKVAYAIMEQLEAINTFLHEFKSLPKIQKDA